MTENTKQTSDSRPQQISDKVAYHRKRELLYSAVVIPCLGIAIGAPTDIGFPFAILATFSAAASYYHRRRRKRCQYSEGGHQ